jgi:hypothetical protein
MALPFSIDVHGIAHQSKHEFRRHALPARAGCVKKYFI